MYPQLLEQSLARGRWWKNERTTVEWINGVQVFARTHSLARLDSSWSLLVLTVKQTWFCHGSWELGPKTFLVLQRQVEKHRRPRTNRERNTSLASRYCYGCERLLGKFRTCHKVIRWFFSESGKWALICGWLKVDICLSGGIPLREVNRNWHYNQWFVLSVNPSVKSLGMDR